MKFAAAILLSMVAIVPSVMGNASTNIRAFGTLYLFLCAGEKASLNPKAPPGTLDHAALPPCLDSYRTDNWDGMDCGVCFVSSLDGVLFIDKTNHRDVDGSVSDRNFFGFESNLTSPS